MQGFELTPAQMEELWTFVRKKQRQLSEWEKEHTEYGDNWIWIVFDPVHKLVPAILVGERTEEEAKGLLEQLKERLAEGVLSLFTSDSLAHYIKAMAEVSALHVFGKWIQPERKGDRGRFPKPRPVAQEGLEYATAENSAVHKKRENGHVISVTTEVIFGKWDDIRARLEELGQTINTSYVERENLTLRHLVSRLRRKTLCFSKKREYLEYHLHLVWAYYHFVLYHSSLRERLPEPIPTRGDGSPKIWRQQTPAISAGLSHTRRV
ncbi:MAG: IS1 family transposase [Anaerolineae bacterium]